MTIEPDRKKRRGGLSAFEAAAVCIVVAAATVLVYDGVYAARIKPYVFFGAAGVTELEPLKRYGLDNRFSRHFEELMIRDFFQERRDGVFLDVGANHYRIQSNTYYLETQLGWSGVAVDALREFGPDYAVHRPRTRFVAMFASDVADGTVQFFVPDNHLMSSSNPEFAKRSGSEGAQREVPTTTLNAVLDQARIAKIDFLTMDIELAEPKALAGFDIGRFQPALVCIEGHREVRQQILDYFAQNRYVLVGKYLRTDPNNLYFQPMR